MAVTGTGPDFSEKKTRPPGPAFTSPWGRITVALGGIENLTLPSSTSVAPKSVLTRIVWVAISLLLRSSSMSDAEKVGWPATAVQHAGTTLSLTVHDVLPTGNGSLQWAPTRTRPIVAWDFNVEID